MSFKYILFFIYILYSINALYTSSGPVVLLNSNNFKKEVLDSEDIWLVEFYAEWCGHCKGFAPEYEKAARALKGVFKIGAIEADKEKEIASKYGIQGFPTVKFFGLNKNNPEDYNRGRTAKDVVSFMFDKARNIVDSKLGGNSKSSSSSSKSSSSHKNPSSEKDVLILSDNDFDDIVYKDENNMYVVAFYAPWCGHCQKLLPEWNQAATQLKGQIKLAKVDATVNTQLANRFGIRGYPTIRIFKPGKKSDSNSEEYNGPRDASGIVQFLLSKLESYGYVPEAKQLISQEIFQETCMDRTGICIIIFLPNIADSSAKERNKYLEIIKNASKSGRGKPIYFLWSQGGDQFDFEEQMNLSFGYPAVIALNYNKKKYAVCRRAFTEDNLKDFILNIFLGKERLMNFAQLKKMKKVTKWDGKDYVAPKEPKEDF